MKLGVGQCDEDVAAAKETAPVADSKSHVSGQCGIDIAVTEAQLAPTVLLTSSVR